MYAYHFCSQPLCECRHGGALWIPLVDLRARLEFYSVSEHRPHLGGWDVGFQRYTKGYLCILGFISM